LLGAFLLRGMLLPLPPGLSHDSWRYLWDARVTLHGISPYVYAPGDKALAPLRDSILYANSRFRNVPTIYPPGAQAVYLLSYLLAPANLFFLKGIFLVFDMVTCVALVVLLRRKGLERAPYPALCLVSIAHRRICHPGACRRHHPDIDHARGPLRRQPQCTWANADWLLHRPGDAHQILPDSLAGCRPARVYPERSERAWRG